METTKNDGVDEEEQEEVRDEEQEEDSCLFPLISVFSFLFSSLLSLPLSSQHSLIQHSRFPLSLSHSLDASAVPRSLISFFFSSLILLSLSLSSHLPLWHTL